MASPRLGLVLEMRLLNFHACHKSCHNYVDFKLGCQEGQTHACLKMLASFIESNNNISSSKHEFVLT